MAVTGVAFRRLMREIKQLQTEPPEGIRITADEENMLDVTGIIQGPDGTPYEGGYFRVKFKFTEEFPAAPPKCTLITKIFHPNVSKSGEICVNTLKKDWKREYGIAHILTTVKCLLIYPNAESALDEAAGKLLLEKYEDYCKHAKLMTQVHATPKTRPPEFDVPSVIPETKPSPSASNSASTSSTVTAPVVPTITVPVSHSRHTTPAPPSTRTYSRQGTPGPMPLLSMHALPLPSQNASTKPISKSSATSTAPPHIVVEPLQTSSNGNNDQAIDLPVVAAGATGAPKSGKDENAMDIETAGKTTASTTTVKAAPATTTLKRSAAAASGGAEKRKKGLKRL